MPTSLPNQRLRKGTNLSCLRPPQAQPKLTPLDAGTFRRGQGMTPQISKRELYGSPAELVLSAIIIFGPPGLMLWSMGAYPFFDQNDPVFIPALAAGFLCGSIFTALKRRTVFRWADKFPGYSWAGVVALGVVTAAGFLGAVVSLNGLLDRHHPTTREYVVIGRHRDGSDHTLRVSPPDSQSSGRLEIDVSEAEYEQSDVGSRVAIDVKPGFFGRPWVAGHRLVN